MIKREFSITPCGGGRGSDTRCSAYTYAVSRIVYYSGGDGIVDIVSN